jgi:branched-chain amino acid transport system permease protein
VSPFSALLRALRDNPDCVGSLGGNPKIFEFAAFVITGTIASVYGVVFVGVEGNVDPTMISWTLRNLTIVMIALGGRFTFLGPIFGALILESTREYIQVHSANADVVVGITIIACALIFPEGLGETVKRIQGPHYLCKTKFIAIRSLANHQIGNEREYVTDARGGLFWCP